MRRKKVLKENYYSYLTISGVINDEHVKSLNYLLKMVTADEPKFTVKMSKFKRDLNWLKKTDEEIIDTLADLVENTVIFKLEDDNKNEKSQIVVHLLSEAIFNRKTDDIDFRIPQKIIDAYLNPEENVELDIYVVRGLKSKYSMVLYELLSADLEGKKNVKKIKLDELREILDITEKYSMFSMFKKRVLDSALEEINQKTDIRAAYKLSKTSRSFTDIEFVVEKK